MGQLFSQNEEQGHQSDEGEQLTLEKNTEVDEENPF
jgi:hypothetical protein